MKKLLFFLLITGSFNNTKAQVGNIWFAKEFNKEIALFNSKKFLFDYVLGIDSNVLQFEIIPLAAASSGELTTLLYRCTSKNKEGIVLGFYGNYWNSAGVVYQGYSFRNFERDSAIQFLTKIDQAIEHNKTFLNDESDNNNICFSYADIDILISAFSTSSGYQIRLFWHNFDSSWDKTAFDRSRRRFQKKLK